MTYPHVNTTSYLADLLSPAWQALTGDQHIAWHFFALDNPILSPNGGITTVGAWTMFVHVNHWLCIADPDYILGDPPPDLVTPASFNLQATIWPIKSKLADTTTSRNGNAYLQISPATPSDRLVFITHPGTYLSPLSKNPWPLAHSSYIAPGTSGLHDLTDRNGYSLSGTENTRKLRIVGPYAKGHPGRTVGRLTIVSTVNGQSNTGTIQSSK